jgi:Ni/Fe-hydrogenase subunit HybB-like protein
LKRLVIPLVLASIPMAIGIHTVTSFLYNGMAARPYWNSSILAPQFQLRVSAGVFALGFLIFTLMLKVAVPISLGEILGDRIQMPVAGVRNAARSAAQG